MATVAVSMAQAQTYTYESVPGDPMQSRIYTLDNGLKVYLSVNKERPRLQTYIAVRTGSRNDPAETTGLAHYLEHIMFKGTTHFGTSNPQAEAPLLQDIENRYERYRLLTDPAQRKQAYHEIDSVSQLAAQYNIPNEYDKLMSAIGAQGTNAFTSNDVTCYVEDIPSNEIENWAKVQSDRFRNMVIRGFHTELEAVYEEYNIGIANDNRKTWAALNKLLYPTHPYGTQTTIGTQDHLKNPSIVNIKNYFNRYYVPNNMAIIMAGDFDPDQVMGIITKYFGNWKPSTTLSRPEYAPVRTLTAPVDTTVIGQEAEYLMMGWKAEGAANYQADTLNVIADMLSNGKAGLIDLDLIQPTKVQDAYAYYEGLHDYGQFVMQVTPKQGQTLEEAQTLLLAEIEKLKKGDFDNTLLQAVVNNMKLGVLKSLQNNRSRANFFMDAFINEQPWKDVVGTFGRMEKMTKEQVVAFANRFFQNNYVTVYKRQGTDTTLVKIDKPAITPIPTNNDKQSAFLREIADSKTTPIAPKFVDYATDLTKADVDANTTLLYKHNDEDDLFNLEFDFPYGNENDSRLGVLGTLIEYAGTKNMSAADYKKAFYNIACDFSVLSSNSHTRIKLSGLNENMPKALNLLIGLIEGGSIGKTEYAEVVKVLEKMRDDAKKDQRSNFNALQIYGLYGATNALTNRMSIAQMNAVNGNDLLALLKNLRATQHMTIMYYGPTAQKDLTALVKKTYPRRKAVAVTPAKSVKYTLESTSSNQILLAPYDAKNIYMMQYTNENREWNADNSVYADLFNEYFGGSMNAIVFQELREARGLAYSAGAAYVEPWKKGMPEYFYTYIITQNDKMMDCVAEFNKLLNDMPRRQASFDIAKQSLQKTLATRRVTRFAVLNSYMNAQDKGINYDIYEKEYSQLPSTTLDELVKYATDRVSNKPYTYLILGDEKNLDIPALEKIAPIKRLTTDQIFGN